MRPLICGKDAKAYVAGRIEAYPMGLDGQPSYLEDEFEGPSYRATDLGIIVNDVPLPRPRPSYAPRRRGRAELGGLHDLKAQHVTVRGDRAGMALLPAEQRDIDLRHRVGRQHRQRAAGLEPGQRLLGLQHGQGAFLPPGVDDLSRQGAAPSRRRRSSWRRRPPRHRRAVAERSARIAASAGLLRQPEKVSAKLG